jgi:hypothetical protein
MDLPLLAQSIVVRGRLTELSVKVSCSPGQLAGLTLGLGSWAACLLVIPLSLLSVLGLEDWLDERKLEWLGLLSRPPFSIILILFLAIPLRFNHG